MSKAHEGIGMTSRRTRKRLIERLRGEGVRSEAVLDAMNETPRHLFVDEALASRAYEDTALPIGYGQTISQPYVVARMTEALLRDGPLNKVLEIGTGSGYQAAVIARVAAMVFTVERIEALATKARKRFRQLDLRNVRVKHDDGKLGWPECGPYDGIIATAAPTAIPAALLEQLAEGGRMVIPVGGAGVQELQLITRTGGTCEQEILEAVSFVPMLTGNS